MKDCRMEITAKSVAIFVHLFVQLILNINSALDDSFVWDQLWGGKWHHSYPAAAAACLRSSRRFRLAGCRRSRPIARSRWCCRCRPDGGGASRPSSPSPWRCRWRWSYAGPGPPASFPPWSRWREVFETGEQTWSINILWIILIGLHLNYYKIIIWKIYTKKVFEQ